MVVELETVDMVVEVVVVAGGGGGARLSKRPVRKEGKQSENTEESTRVTERML